MQADIDDDKVIQSLLEDPDDHIIVSSVPDDGRAFILQSQQINRWDRDHHNNEYKRLSAEGFRPRQSCILSSTSKEKQRFAIAVIVKQIEQKPLILQPPKLPSKSPPKRIEKSLPHSQYLMPRKTYTPPLAPKLLCNMEKPDRKKPKPRSKSSQQYSKPEPEQVKAILNLPVATQIPSNKKPYRVRVANFSFDYTDRDEEVTQRNQRELIEHMKHEALLKRLKFQPSFQKHLPESEERDDRAIFRQRQKVQNHMLHYFRTKKMMRNRKLELIM